MSKTLFVGGLAFSTNESDLYKYFSNFGDIEKINIVKDPKTHASKGYGFVFFKSEDPVFEILNISSHYILGRKVDCQSAMRKSEKKHYKKLLAKTRIFVTNLLEEVNNKDMEHFFNYFGKVKSAYIIRDPDTEVSLGFGFVIFERTQDALRVVKNPDLYIKGGKIECDFYKDEGQGEMEFSTQ